VYAWMLRCQTLCLTSIRDGGCSWICSALRRREGARVRGDERRERTHRPARAPTTRARRARWVEARARSSAHVGSAPRSHMRARTSPSTPAGWCSQGQGEACAEAGRQRRATLRTDRAANASPCWTPAQQQPELTRRQPAGPRVQSRVRLRSASSSHANEQRKRQDVQQGVLLGRLDVFGRVQEPSNR
jgi:hypothetical protein